MGLHAPGGAAGPHDGRGAGASSEARKVATYGVGTRAVDAPYAFHGFRSDRRPVSDPWPLSESDCG